MAGLLVILSGPGGVGKDTVLNSWMSANPNVVRVVACTTRPRREKEIDGVDYHFLTIEEFERRHEGGMFLEAKYVYGNWYATPEASVEVLLSKEKVVVLKVDVQGALAVMEKRSDAVSIFILPPNVEELKRRLRADVGTRSKEDIEKRINHAELELGLADHYQYRVVNETVEQCVASIQQIIENERLRAAV